MRVAIVGVEGQLGSALLRSGGGQVIALSRENCDLSAPETVEAVIARERPTVVVNTAAYTAVDKAETERDAAFAINATGVKHLADACRRLEIPLIQISTDYVFGGEAERKTPFKENDPTSPQGEYAKSKLAGEDAARAWSKHFVVRTCGLYGLRAKPSQANFVDTMLRLGRDRDKLRIVADQFCTPTYVEHLVKAIWFLAGSTAYGTYHVTNAGSTNWHGFATEIFRLTNKQITLEPITAAEYGAPAPRPGYSVLDIGKYQALGGPPMPTWQAALQEYLTTNPQGAVAQTGTAGKD